MPGMNGRLLVEKITEIRPKAQIIYMSGYSGFAHRDLVDPETSFLSKPFTRELLLRKVYEVLAFDAALKSN